MLEQALENLAEADQDQVPWTGPGLMDKKTDRDSSLTSSEAELGREELAKLKKHFLSPGEQVSEESQISVCVLFKHGIVGLNQHLLNFICLQQEDKKVEVAEMIGSLVSFLMICLFFLKI